MKHSCCQLICVFLLSLIGLLSVKTGLADGSKDLYPKDKTGRRAYLRAHDATTSNWPFANHAIHYVYAKVGETITMASSAQGAGGNARMRLYAPNGLLLEDEDSEGQILNRTAELAGPLFPGESAGGNKYLPLYHDVTVEGIYRVEFVAPGEGDPQTGTSSYDADADWSQPNNAGIMAWDVSVINETNDFIPGRVYTNVLNLSNGIQNPNTTGFEGIIYVLTKDGYIYRVNNNGNNGMHFTFFVNNLGFVDEDTQEPIYQSLVSSAPEYLEGKVHDPNNADTDDHITHKLFYTMPADDLPALANGAVPGGSTWLKIPTDALQVQNLKLTGVDGTTEQVSRKGGIIQFDATTQSRYTITIESTNSPEDFDAITITGATVIGENNIFWDGKDGVGDPLPPGVVPARITAQLQGAEVHFPFFDMEYNRLGTIIELLDHEDNYNSVESDIVYWNDDDVPNSSNGTNPDPKNASHLAPTNSTGISSTANGHKWGVGGSGTGDQFGDNRAIDTWTFVEGDALFIVRDVDVRVADLEVASVIPTADPKVNIGDEITYQVKVRNNNDPDIDSESGVAGAPFQFVVPDGFTINIEDINYTSGDPSCGTVNGEAIDDEGNYTALLDMPSGCEIDFTITGTVGVALSGSLVDVKATIMRPNDVTDPDATNPDPEVPPTDPEVECGGDCNNILGNNTILVNISPITDDDPRTISQDETIVIAVLGNDDDTDGTIDETTVQLLDPDSGDPAIDNTVMVAGEGTYTVNATTGVVTFDPVPAFAGISSVQYIVSDDEGGLSEPADITITVTPIGNPETNETPIGVAVSTDVRANDGPDDVGGDPIGSSLDLGAISDPANGTAIEDPENPGQILYTPDDDFIGKDTYTYTLTTDDGVVSEPIEVVIEVKPVGENDDITVNANSSVTTEVVSNDGPSKVGTEVNIDTPPTNGEAVVNPDGKITYTPDEDFYGTDTYTYTLTTDDGVVSDPITVTVTVEANPSVTFTKEADESGLGDPVAAGDEITYTFTLTNTGNVTLSDIEVTDDKVGTISWTVDGTAWDPATDDLAVGKSAIGTVTYTVMQDDVDAGSVKNQAFASVTPPTPDPGNPPAPITDIPSDDPGTPDESGDATDIDIPQAGDLSFVKEVDLTDDTDGNAEVSLGDILTYTFTVTNMGNVTLSDVEITDTDVAGLGTLAYTWPDTDNEGVLLPGESVTATAEYTVKQGDVDAGEISNQALVSAVTPPGVEDIEDVPSGNDPTDPGTPDEPGDATDIDIPQAGDLSFVKEVDLTDDADGNAEVSLGDILTYTFTVTNTGNVTLSDVEITDTDVAGLGTLAYTWPDTDNEGVLLPGEAATATATYTVKQGDVDVGEISNQALVSAVTPPGVDDIEDVPSGNDPTDPGTPGDPGDATGIDIPQEADLSFVKAVDLTDDADENGEVSLNDVLTYTFTVANTGNVTLSGVEITDTDVAGLGTLTYIWPGVDGVLAPDESVTATATYTVKQDDVDAGVISNQALVSAVTPPGVDDIEDVPSGNDPTDPGTPGDPGDATDIDIPQEADLSFVKAVDLTDDADENGEVSLNDVLTYTFTVANTGNVTLSDVAVTDDLTGLGTLSYTWPDTDNEGVLIPGESVTATAEYTVTQTDVDAGVISNQAEVSVETPPSAPDIPDTPSNDPGTPSEPDDATDIDVPQHPAIDLIKTFTVDNSSGEAGRVDAGDEVTYTFEVTNTGNVTLTDVGLTEIAFSGTGDYELPADAVFVPAGGSAEGTLVPGETATYTLTYILTQDDIDAGKLDNSSLVTGTPPSGAAGNVTDESDTATAADGTAIGDPGTEDNNGDGDNGNDPTETTLPKDARMELVKSASHDDADGDGRVSAGDGMDYTFTVTNLGNVTLDEIAVNDDLLGGAVAGPAGGDTDDDGLLDVGEVWVYQASYAITQEDIDAGVLTNTATVEGKDPQDVVVSDESDTGTDPDGGTITDPSGTDSDGDGNDGNDPTETTLPALPSIDLIKTFTVDNSAGEAGRVDAGDEITYTFEVTNTGNVTLTDVGLTEIAFSGTGDYELPTDAVFVSSTGGSPVGTLAPGEAATYTLAYTLTQDDIDAGKLDNSSLVTGTPPSGTAENVTDESDTAMDADGTVIGDPSGTDSDGDGNDGNDPTETTLPAAAGIDLIKTFTVDDSSDEAGRIDAGDKVTYTFEVTNTGNVTLTDIGLSEIAFSGTGDYELPADAVFVSSTVNSAEGTLAPGETATYTLTYTLTQDDIDAGKLDNSSLVTGTPPSGTTDNVTDESDTGTGADGIVIDDPSHTDSDGDGDDDNDRTTTDLPQIPSLAVTKVITSAGPYDSTEDVITYDIVITNTGNVTIDNIELTDANAIIPTGEENIGTLAPGTATTVTVTHAITQADLDNGSVSNQASADGEDPNGDPVTDDSDDPGTGDPDDATDIDVVQHPELTVTKVITSTGPYDSTDDAITYDIVITNTGNVTIDNIVLTDDNAVIPAGEENAGTLAPGTAKTVTVTHAVTQDDLDNGGVSNTATAGGEDPNGDPVTDDSDDPDTPDPDDATDITVVQQPELTITKTAREGEYALPGDVITYDLTITNTGNVTLKQIEITDANADAGSITPATVAILAPGETVNATATHTITQDDIDAGFVSNSAEVTGDAPNGDKITDVSHDPDPQDPDAPTDDDCTDCTITPIEVKPAVALVAVATNSGSGRNGAFIIGDEIEYRFTVTNMGNTTLNSFVLNDAKLGLDNLPVDETLAPGESFTRMFRYAVTAEDILAKQVVTTATVNADSPTGETAADISGDKVTNDVPTMVPVAEGPESAADRAETPQHTPITISVTDNDKEGSSDIDLATVRLIDPETGDESTEVTIEGEGTYTVADDGTITFTPIREFYGESSIQYVVSDVNGLQADPANITLTVVRSKPEAINDTQTGSFNGPVEIELVNNDQPDTAPLDPSTIDIVSPPQHGTLQIGADGVVTYSPNQYYTGPDEFSYRVQDANGNWTNVATVRITVSGFNIPNIITPNGDGQNDRLVIVGLSDYDNAEVTIFNRWGNEIYRSSNYRQDWDAQGVNEGTYYYLITLKKDGRETVHKGWILVKRK